MIELDEEIQAAFAGIVRERYIRDRLRHYEQFDPQRFGRVGEEGFRRFAELALSKAEGYNMLAEREVNGLETLMYFFGCGFDADPLFPWARFRRFPDKDKTSRKEPESFTHLKKVYDQFYGFFTGSEGPDSAHAHAARERLRAMKPEDFAAPRSDDALLGLARDLWPERYALLPAAALRETALPQARKKSAELSLSPARGTALLFMAMFLSGSFPYEDPLYPELARLAEHEGYEEREKGLLQCIGAGG